MYRRKWKLLVILLPRDKPLLVFNILYSILSLYINICIFFFPFIFKKFEIILHHVCLFVPFTISSSLSINSLWTWFLTWLYHIPVIVHFSSEILEILYFMSWNLFLGTIFPVCPSLNKRSHLLPMASLFMNAPETFFQIGRSNWCAQSWLLSAVSLLIPDRCDLGADRDWVSILSCSSCEGMLPVFFLSLLLYSAGSVSWGTMTPPVPAPPDSCQS